MYSGGYGGSLYAVDRVVYAMGEEIMINETAHLRQVNNRIHESAPRRIIIPCPDVVQPRLLVSHVAPIAERVEDSQCSFQGAVDPDGFAPGIVFVFYHLVPTAVKECYYVALQVMHVGIGGFAGAYALAARSMAHRGPSGGGLSHDRAPLGPGCLAGAFSGPGGDRPATQGTSRPMTDDRRALAGAQRQTEAPDLALGGFDDGM